jgi:ATP-binding cassette subfamily B multidrug efflux pump
MSSSLIAQNPEAAGLRVWRGYLPLIKGARLELFWGMVFLVASTAFLVRASVLLGQICVDLTSARFSANGARVALIFMGLEIASILSQYLGRRSFAQGTNKILLNLRYSLFAKLSGLPMDYYDAQPLGRIITRVTNDVEGMEGFFGGSLARMTTAMVQIVIVLISIISLDSKYGLLVVLAALPSMGLSWLTRRPLGYWLRESKSRNAQMNSTLAEFIQGLPILRVMGLENWSRDEFGRDTEKHFDSSMKVLAWNSFIRPLTVFLSILPAMTAAVIGGFLLTRGQIELALIIAVLRLTERFTSPVRVLTQEIQLIQDATSSATRVAEMLNRESESLNSGAGYNAKIKGDIEFSNVFLSYRGGKEILRGINFRISAGQKVGLLGHSGSGKSSIINLIPALYSPTNGAVLIDGVKLSNWDLNVLRSQIGYLSQEPFLFRGSLAANILGNEKSNNSQARSQFIDLIQDLGLLDIFNRFSGGLNFLVNDAGSNLSSGEKQMIAFFRLIADKRRIIIMDEASSSLDRAWEEAMQSAIVGLLKHHQCTAIVIAHRLETLKTCDRLISLHSGKVISDEMVNDV